MSKVPYTVNVDEYVCSALEQIRAMSKNLDFSGLMAAVERIQHHANQMEAALSVGVSNKYYIKKILKDGSLSKKEKLEKISEVVNE